MKTALGGVLAVVCLTACGDNSKECGDGTGDEDGDGICEPDGTTDLICGDGTVFDPLTTECVPDPSVCGNGTVLINGECQDPTADLDIDLIEGPEPNGFELDATSAGTITIRPLGETFVINGCVTPTGNNSPDLDVYEFDVAGPTLIHIAADGVQGLAAGFLVFGDNPALSDWFRLGINIATDTSKRELFLPVAGRYQLVMTDTRTLLPLTQNGEGFPAAGNPDGTSCYYVTISQRAIPTPASLDLANGTTGEIGEELKFFTGNFPTGFINLFAVIDPEDVDFDGVPDFDTLGNPIDSRAATSLVLTNNTALRQIADADADSPVIDLLFAGIKQGDSTVVVLDYVWNYAIGPAQFAIEAPVQTSSLALSTTGGTVDTTTNGTAFAVGGEPVFENVNLFHFDVTAAGQIDAFDLSFDRDMQGSLIDQDGVFASPFTNLSGPIHTFRDYEGLIRHLAPGRYYFFLFAPNDAVGTALSVTSTITTVAPGAIVLDTPTAATAFNSVRSVPFTFATGGEPWHSLDATLVGTTDPVQISLFDPAVTTPQTPGFAFGRLDPMSTINGGFAGVRAGDGTPLVVTDQNGTAPLTRLFKNPFAALPAFPTSLLVKVNPTATVPTTFSLDFETRIYDDFAGPVIDAGMQKNDSAALTAGSEERYYFETAPGNTVAISIAPDGSQPTLDLALVLLDELENEIEVLDDAGNNLGESTTFTAKLSGFTAFKVRGGSGTTTGAFTVTVAVTAADYTASQAPSPFVDACLGGQSVPLNADLSGFDPDDEGLSSPIAAPTGFTLHGQPATFFKVSSNGFLSFDAGILEALFTSGPLFTSGGAVNIAPHWDDLVNVTVCTQATATTRVIQWEGIASEAGAPVQFQAILDANGTIEYRYGPFHFSDASTATIGVQNAAGDEGLELGVDLPIAVPNSSIKLTPN